MADTLASRRNKRLKLLPIGEIGRGTLRSRIVLRTEPNPCKIKNVTVRG